MRIVYAINGLLMIVIGIVATVSDDLTADRTWLLALWLGALGLAGLLGTVATTISTRSTTTR